MPDAALIERDAKLFEAGDYPDKGITVTEDELDTIASGTKDAPVKIEHVDTAFDGAMGVLRSARRVGKELMGRIGFTREAWALIDRAKARRLSVAVKRDKTGLVEVSIVKQPRIASAAVFDDRIELDGVVEFGFGGLSASDISDRISDILKPSRTLNNEGAMVNSGPWPYVTALHEDHAVVELGGKHFNYPFTVNDGTVTLSKPVEVVQDWKPATTCTMSDITDTQEGDTMADEKDNAAQMSGPNGDISYSDALKALQRFRPGNPEAQALFDSNVAIITMAQESREEVRKAGAAARAAMKELQRANTDTFVERMKREGKLVPAVEHFARAILQKRPLIGADYGSEETVRFTVEKDGNATEVPMHYADAFAALLEAMPPVVSFQELAKANAEADSQMSTADAQFFREKLGLDPEKVTKVRKGEVV